MKKYIFIFTLLLMVGITAYHFLPKSHFVISYDQNSFSEKASAADAVPAPPTHLDTPEPVRAIYMTSWVAGTPKWRDELVRFVEKTELNSIVIDVKDYSGHVAFVTGDEDIGAIGGEEKRVADFRQFIGNLHRRGIYAIARIAVFQDPVYAKARPEFAVVDSRGGLWKDKNGLLYVDPSAREFWDYIVAIARASERVGFDELNFDYIRFPSDGPMQYIAYPISGDEITMPDVMESFFQYLSAKLQYAGVPLSADLFGFVTERTDDLNIGQILERAEPYFDYLSPMVYPSHYQPGHLELSNPAANPYLVVNNAVKSGMERLVAASSTPSKLRPWIQDFDLGAEYDAAMVRKEKQAIYDAGLESWMAWDPANKYTRGAYDDRE